MWFFNCISCKVMKTLLQVFFSWFSRKNSESSEGFISFTTLSIFQGVYLLLCKFFLVNTNSVGRRFGCSREVLPVKKRWMIRIFFKFTAKEAKVTVCRSSIFFRIFSFFCWKTSFIFSYKNYIFTSIENFFRRSIALT